MNILSTSTKTNKSVKYGYLTGIIYLNPTAYNSICPFSTPDCIATCIHKQGMLAWPASQKAQIARTELYLNNKKEFMASLYAEIEALIKRAKKSGLKPAIRLNGSSDLPWYKSEIFSDFPGVQFYDYTKVLKYWQRNLLINSNYHITFSDSGINLAECNHVLASGGTIARVVHNKNNCDHDGDIHDLTFLHGSGIIGLKPKGKAIKIVNDFIRLV